MKFERNLILYLWIFIGILISFYSIIIKTYISLDTVVYLTIALGILFLSFSSRFSNSLVDRHKQYKPADNYHFFLTLLFLGSLSCIPLLIENIGNLNRDLSSIREDQIERRNKGSIYNSINLYLSPFIFVSYTILNLSRRRVYITISNIIALLICLCFVFITGGRLHFLVFGLIFVSTALVKNKERILSNTRSFYLRSLFYFTFISLGGSIYSTIRTGVDTERLIEFYLSSNQVKTEATTKLLSSPIGQILYIPIRQSFEYNGQCLVHFSMFLEFQDRIPITYGLYEFNILDRFGIIDWLEIHDLIDRYYSVKFDINYNVWATIFRELIVDFGILGSLAVWWFLCFMLQLSLYHFKARLSSQVLYVFLLATLLFSPFLNILNIRMFSISFLAVLVWFILSLMTNSYSKPRNL